MNLEEAYSEFKKLLKKHFPELFFRNTGYSGSDFDAELASENKMLVNTKYFYKEDLNFIHWTSVDNLLSILNNREFRLYNLHSSKDENEFYYAARELGLEDTEIEYAKKYYYHFSFSKKTDLPNKYLWDEYGKKCSGVAIEFSIVNDPKKWDKYLISNVYYNVPDSFKAFRKDIEELKQRYHFSTKGFNIGKLIGFHKEEDYIDEKEVRIATFFPFKGFEEYLKFAKTEFRIDNVNNRSRITNYISLPLWVDNNSQYIRSNKVELNRTSLFDDEYFSTRPKLKIDNIYFGVKCGLDNSNFSKFRNQLQDIIRFNLGYIVELDRTLYEPKII